MKSEVSISLTFFVLLSVNTAKSLDKTRITNGQSRFLQIVLTECTRHKLPNSAVPDEENSCIIGWKEDDACHRDLDIMVDVHDDEHLSTLRQTPNGPVEGIEETSSLGQKYYAFRGIPFAEPPITGRDPYTGDNVDRRFKPPKPLKRKWRTPLLVHTESKTCIQSDITSGYDVAGEGSEDCLFLNIYVPAGGSKNKTVMAAIPGGAFLFGTSSAMLYGPDFLMSHDNILVVMQYRVGIFGFLNLGHGEYTGNMGLKDVQMALKWIYENIENFSGNKHEIMLFGPSSGGSMVSYQMLNEESRKYFNRAYMASGTALDFQGFRRSNHRQTIQKCFQLDKIDEIIDFLKSNSAEVLTSCSSKRVYNSILLTWVPTVEPADTNGSFLNASPAEIYTSDSAPVMDSLFTFTSQEWIVNLPKLLEKTEPWITEDVMEENNFTLPFEGFTKELYPKEYAKAMEILRNAYFSDTSSVDAIQRSNIALWSYAGFIYGTIKAAVLQANANNKGQNLREHKNTFLYRFSVHSDLNSFYATSKRNYTGATHSDDMCYIFHRHTYDDFNMYDSHLQNRDINYDIIMRMVKMITNFARTGNPSIDGDTPFRPCKSSDEIFCQEISNAPKSSITYDIKKQLHYNAWEKIEEIYDSLNIQHPNDFL